MTASQFLLPNCLKRLGRVLELRPVGVVIFSSEATDFVYAQLIVSREWLRPGIPFGPMIARRTPTRGH
jgi:prepilin signal peptidase PulO-like enzyme (type II secretory pathway)